MNTRTKENIADRNFIFNAAEGGLWVAGAMLVSAQTVLPALLIRLGGGNLAVGVLGVIIYAGVFLPQIFAARYGQTRVWKKPLVIGLGVAQRCVVLLMGFTIFFFGAERPGVALGTLLCLYALNQLILGVTTPVWFDFYAKVTPLERRGRLTAARSSIAGALSLPGGLLLTWLLGTFGYPVDYSLAFGCAFLLQALAIFFQARIVEEEPSDVMPRQSLREYFSHVRGVVTSHVEFTSFLLACACLILATVPAGFYTVYALRELHAPERSVGQFTLLIVAGQISGAVLNGYLADHAGNRIAIISSAGAACLGIVLALLAPSLAWFRPVFFLMGMNLGSEMMTRYNLAIEYGPTEQRATYIGLMNTLLAPLYAASLAGGWISDYFGYRAVFALGAFCSVAGILILLFRVRDPRFQARR